MAKSRRKQAREEEHDSKAVLQVDERLQLDNLKAFKGGLLIVALDGRATIRMQTQLQDKSSVGVFAKVFVAQT